VSGVGDGPMQSDNVTVMNIRHFAIGTNVLEDMPEHDAIVMPGLLGLS
jgi:hypothetical protein